MDHKPHVSYEKWPEKYTTFKNQPLQSQVWKLLLNLTLIWKSPSDSANTSGEL